MVQRYVQHGAGGGPPPGYHPPLEAEDGVDQGVGQEQPAGHQTGVVDPVLEPHPPPWRDGVDNLSFRRL